jgi:hypothetical protein
VLALLLAVLMSVSAGRRMEARKAAKTRPARAMATAKARPLELPPQPEPEAMAAPDLIVKEIEIEGPAGPWQARTKYSIAVVLQNIGQWESGAFMTRLSVRTQVPGEGKDETEELATGRVGSIPPRKTGLSTGTGRISFEFTTGDYVWAQYTFTAEADSTGHISEFDEANNELVSADMVVDTLRD